MPGLDVEDCFLALQCVPEFQTELPADFSCCGQLAFAQLLVDVITEVKRKF